MGNETKKLAPRASILIESLRDVGYSLPTAVSDIIDNSIAAQASHIRLLSNTNSDQSAIAIVDDGVGMNNVDLLEAMRLGTKNPKDTRKHSDLGRFGLGLKTASFSQCRRLTVVSRKNHQTSCAIWDLDTIATEDKWIVEIPNDLSQVPWISYLPSPGTLVIWEKLDRLLDKSAGFDQHHITRQIDETASHIEFVFHRYLSGQIPGNKKVRIDLNGRELIAFDPFNSKHPATLRDPCEIFQFKGDDIRIQPYTLPHHVKVSREEWEKFGRSEGYVKNQGFYLYRNNRLIIHGTWFGLAKQSELTKLSRVQIDITNKLDAYWKIDIKKASAQIPPLVREKLRNLIQRIGATSKKVYRKRGAHLTQNSPLHVWRRRQDKSRINYCLNEDHPALTKFVHQINEKQCVEFKKILRLIETTIPIDSLFIDYSADPRAISQQIESSETFADLVESTYTSLENEGICSSEILTMMEVVDPFRENWAETLRIINYISSTEMNS